MTRKFIIIYFTLILSSLIFLGANPVHVKTSYENDDEYPRGCSYLKCAKGDQCVNRKFWCKNPPCPSMLYCSKSKKESIKGPSSCEFVRCSKGYVCLVRARHCRWNQKCRQQIARCVSEREYYEGATSCADFKCPEGHQCILRESLCARPPCKLLKSCAKLKDVQTWFDLCKDRGCPSEHECFLRKPFGKCSSSPCKHTPDCTSTDDTEKEGSDNEYCRGWVCPPGQKCSAHIKEPCKLETCKIIRSCHGPLILPENQPANSGTSSWKPAKYQPVTVIPTPPSSARNGEPKNRTLTQVEREFILRDQNNGKPLSSTSATIGATTNAPRMRFTDLRNAPQQRDNFGIYRGSIQLDDVISTVSTSTAMGDNEENLVYNEPISVATTIKPTSIVSVTPSSSGILRSPQPTLASLSSWLNHLQLKTGIDAIEQWVKNAQSRKHYQKFEEWLRSVKELLGPQIFETWLEEVRSLTQENPEFQEWLPKPPGYQTLDSHHFHDPDSKTADMENEGLTNFPKLEILKEQSNENLIRKNKEDDRSSRTVPDSYNFSSKRKNESEQFLSNFPENVMKYDKKSHSEFKDVLTSTTTTTTAATPTNPALWMKPEISSHPIIHNNSLSQVSSENSVIYPQKLPTITTTIITGQNKNDESTMKFGKSDSKLSNEFHVGENSYFEKPTESPKDLDQPYGGLARHQQEPEVEKNVINVHLDYPDLMINQNLSNDPYRSFENFFNDPYVQKSIPKELDYYSNPTRNVISPGTIVYNVYRNDLQEIPPFTESYQISEYPFSDLSFVYPQRLVKNDFQNFWNAPQLASPLPRARTRHSNSQWTFSKYPDFKNMNTAVKSKVPYNKYPFDFGYYEGTVNKFKPENNQQFIQPKLIQDHSIRDSRNLLAPKFTFSPYEPLFNDQNHIASRYVSLLGYVPQIPVDEKEQALTTYSLSRNPLEMNPFDKYSRPSVDHEKIDDPQFMRSYDTFLDQKILENTEISVGDAEKMDLQVLPQKYQGSLERQNLKRNRQSDTWKESEYGTPDEILPENKPKMSNRYLSWKFPERQKVSQDRKSVVTSHPEIYKGFSENRTSEIDRSYIFHGDDYVHKNGGEITKSTESLPTEEAKITNEYLSEIQSSTVPNNVFQRQPSDYLIDEYSETFGNTPQDRHVERLTEIPENIVITIPADDALLKFWKKNENEDSSNYEIANENNENYFENSNFEKNSNYMNDPTRHSSLLKNNSNNTFAIGSNFEFLKNHLNDNKNYAVNSETRTVPEDQKKNIFKDEKYGGYSEFPKNLKIVYNVGSNVELKRHFGNYVVPRSSNENMTMDEMTKWKSEQKNNNYEDEESTVDYSETDKDDRFSQFVTKSSNPNSKNPNFQNGDIDYANEHYEEEEYDVTEEGSQKDEQYKEKQEEE